MLECFILPPIRALIHRGPRSPDRVIILVDHISWRVIVNECELQPRELDVGQTQVEQCANDETPVRCEGKIDRAHAILLECWAEIMPTSEEARAVESCAGSTTGSTEI